MPLGVATSLAARSRYAFGCDGAANHAGTTPMGERDDALVAAARFVLAADAPRAPSRARSRPSARSRSSPAARTSIPGRVTGTLDVRAPDPARRDAVVAAVRAACPEASLEELAADDGVAFDQRIRGALHDAAGAVAIDLASYAGHDAGVLAAAGVPAGMLFVRSPDGVSHDPAEHADDADCLAGVAALERSVARVSRGSPECGVSEAARRSIPS